MELTQQQIEKKIAELTQQRDDFVKQSNEQLALLIGALSVYNELLSQITTAESETINKPVVKKITPQHHHHGR